MNKMPRVLRRRFSQFAETEWNKKAPLRNNYIRKYEAIPEDLKIVKKDPFDYPLRTKEEVMKDFKDYPLVKEIRWTELNNANGY